ncbi:MAG: hypothetical protein P0Y65_11255 [Candidatus Devosia phytovorans]|uniref:Uncharacterized protein n=1 Tax=Candidatus Devosia phytovorans TaxID=3121372 RepID=A0AAJ5VQB3_9HYPH|nr:hypothetical protein [Devosia sp.]WEK02786.1 MAG: hypothetical protein P0Y65_11255 [Devosia sp.]
MKHRLVIVRTGTSDKLAALVRTGKNLTRDDFPVVDEVSIRLAAPVAWEIPIDIKAGNSVVEWGLYSPDSIDSCDPLSLFRVHADQEYRLQFIDWLEHLVAAGEGSLGIDMEGGYAAIVVSGTAPTVTLSAWTYPDRLEFAVRIERRVLVRDFYTALNAFWESDVLKSAWAQWSSKPKWRLRSAIVETYLASSGV